MKRYVLFEINEDSSAPLSISDSFDRITGGDGTIWFGSFHGGRVVTDDELSGKSGGADLIKALAVAVHRDAAVAAITGDDGESQ